MPIAINRPDPPTPTTVSCNAVQHGRLYRIATASNHALVGKMCIYNGNHLVVFYLDGFEVVGPSEAKSWTFEPVNTRTTPAANDTSVVIT